VETRFSENSCCKAKSSFGDGLNLRYGGTD
jgi:hypothetical protein